MQPLKSNQPRWNDRRTKKVPALVLASFLLSVTPSHAGIMDSVGGFFSNAVSSVKGLFGGKAKASEGQEGEFDNFLTQVEESQAALYTAQEELINYYNENDQQVDIKDAKAQELNNAVADASRTNEDLYLNLLKARAALLEQETDISAYNDRLGEIQANQKELEESYQRIQDSNKEKGLIEPPPSTGTDPVDPDPSDKPFDPNDPQIAGFIDEWLASKGLDGYGRILGASNGVVITANYDADTDGRTRHVYVWEELWNDTGMGGQTLGDYVKSRMDGGDSATPAPPATQDPATPPPATGGGSTIDDLTASTDAPDAAIEPVTLEGINSELKAAVASFQELQGTQQGTGPKAESLLKKIRELEKQKKEMFGEASN